MKRAMIAFALVLLLALGFFLTTGDASAYYAGTFNSLGIGWCGSCP
jgi:hypothetical protein